MANKKAEALETRAYTNTKEAGFCVYIGPTILGIIQNGTIYQGNKKQALNSRAFRTVHRRRANHKRHTAFRHRWR